MDLIITRGIPASGKTTWARAWVAEDPGNRLRVNRDDLRQMLYNKPFGVDEDTVSSLESSAVNAALRRGKSVVVDATHLHPRSLQRWEFVATKYKAALLVQDFDCSIDEAIQRDQMRSRTVGAEVIRNMAHKRAQLLA